MAYGKNGFPLEQASKIGHMKMVTDPTLRQIIETFQADTPGSTGPLISKTGTVDLKNSSAINRIVTIDGGEAVVPNPIRREKCIAFVQVGACMLKMQHLRYMRDHPMMDPREIQKRSQEAVWYNPAVIPLSGLRLPGRTIKETIRLLLHSTLSSTHTGLYDTLKYLVYREWEPKWPSEEEKPSMHCIKCEKLFDLPRGALLYNCPHCGNEHWLSDYLSLIESSPDEWSKEETAKALRDVLETLTLFHYLRIHHNNKKAMSETLFIKDGPLLLRAALSRLVEPIRAFIEMIKKKGHVLHLVGVEKTGDMVNLLDEFKDSLPSPGDFFLPSVQFLLEEVAGKAMPTGYRNRVSYGAKIAARLGKDHIIALNVPTGIYYTEPKVEDLIGLEGSIRILSELVSYQYPNAIIPLVLANSAVSIARKPSGDILTTFTEQMMGND
jgi:hypothetical protein